MGKEIKPRGRPKKARHIQKTPKIMQFSPRGKPGRPEEIMLEIDHFEAMRLVDLENCNQDAAAVQMGISRATFGRILREARRRVSNALVQGKIIKIFT